MLPEAPVRFSTRNDFPVLWVSCWATSRVTTSTADAAAKGLMSVTGFVGHSPDWAKRGLENATRSRKNRFMTKGYLNVPWGQVHFRTVDAPSSLPLLILLHQSPLSSE